ncbi:MAG TPA: transposase, partial [Actinomycetes bacterium]|nr:transposase [Actinomycetes bacterium]
KGHRSLTLVTEHRSGKVVWGAEGKDTATCDQFLAELGEHRAAKLAAVSTDMGAADLKSVAKPGHAPNATVCIDPFHVVALASGALDQVRRQVWNQLRAVDPDKAKKFKGARWVLPRAPRASDRHPGRHPAHAAPPRRRGLARPRAQGGPAGGLRRRPHPERDDRAAGPLVRQGRPQPPGPVRQARRHRPHPP